MTNESLDHKVELREIDLTRLQRLADALVRHVPPGTTIGLVGTLGAGKTTLVQAIARAAGIDTSNVTSPTFTLHQTHRGSITLHHLDAYRVADEEEFLELGVDELFEDATAWTLVEWADLVKEAMPIDTLWLTIELDPNSESRIIRLESTVLDLAPLTKI